MTLESPRSISCRKRYSEAMLNRLPSVSVERVTDQFTVMSVSSVDDRAALAATLGVSAEHIPIGLTIMLDSCLGIDPTYQADWIPTEFGGSLAVGGIQSDFRLAYEYNAPPIGNARSHHYPQRTFGLAVSWINAATVTFYSPSTGTFLKELRTSVHASDQGFVYQPEESGYSPPSLCTTVSYLPGSLLRQILADLGINLQRRYVYYLS